MPNVIPVSEVFAEQVKAELQKLREAIIDLGHVQDYICFVPATQNPEAQRKVAALAEKEGWYYKIDGGLIKLATLAYAKEHPDGDDSERKAEGG